LAQYDINLREYWRILKKRKFIVIFTAVVLGFFSTFFAVLKAPTPIYSSVCSIRFEKETTVEGLYAKTISWSGGDDIETQISVIKSYPVLKEVAEKMRLVPRRDVGDNEELKSNIIALVEGLQAKVEVTRENYTNILDIRVEDADPAFAQKLANTIGLTYKELHSRQQMKRTTEAIRYIEDQLKTVQERLRESEDAFNRFSQENQLISIDLQSENLLARSQDIQKGIRSFQEDEKELAGILGRLREFIKDPARSDHNFYSSKAGTQYQTTNDTLVGLLLQKDSMLEDYTPQHPEVIAVSRKIAENARKMAILLDLKIKNTQEKMTDSREEARKIESKTNVLMEKKLEYDRLKRKVESYNDMTALLERKNQEALIRQAEKPEEISIVRPARLAATPINPPKTVTTGALGVLIGLILGLVTAFIVETFDTSLGAIEDVEETLGAQVLGVIPHADTKEILESLAEQYPEGGKGDAFKTPHLVSHFSPNSMIAESFRALRTNIQFKGAGDKVKTVGVTSASPQEGKTLVSINLAITMAQAGMKTLLVGSDMRKPMLARIFGVEMGPGLADILLGNHPWQDTVKTITDLIMGKMTLDEIMMTPGLDNLHLITSGAIPPNPAILIESKRLETFIEEAKMIYDLIVFDSPPILSTADAAILGAKMDGVLLTYRVGTVSKGLLKRSSTQLEQVKCNVLGVILNGMKPEISPDFQDFKYYKYYYSYGGEDKESRGKGKKRGFFSLRGRGKGRGEQRAADSPGKGRIPREDRAAGSRAARISLMILALALLGGGLLWQNGIIDPNEWFGPGGPSGEEPVQHAVKGRLPERETAKGPEKGDTKKNGAPDKVPAPAPLDEAERPESQSPAGEGQDRETEGSPEEAQAAPEGVEEGKSPQPQPAATPVLSEETGGETDSGERPLYPYSLYLGSYRTLERAKRAVSTFGEKGLSSYWAGVELQEKGTWFRVFAGHFTTREEAEKFGQDHGLWEAAVKKTRYANLIGVYRDPKELEEKIRTLQDLGFSPYVIEDQEGRSRLLVGAYLTRKGAERQYQELEEDGVEAEIVLK
jgi:succinoglycan biosynthesis transport protein ExoP